jgi:hypothetical protein
MPTFDNYEAFLYGVENQLASYASPTDPADTHPADPAHLLPHHLDMLIDLQQALVQRSSSPNDALAAWEHLRPQLQAEVEASKAEVTDGNADAIEQRLTDANKNIFVASAYQSAAHAAQGHLEAPDAGDQKAKLDQAQKEFLEADKLWDGATKVMSTGVDKMTGIEGTQEIVDLVTMPGSIEEKLQAAKDKGQLEQLATVVDLVGKIQGATKSVLKLTAQVGERYCDGMAKSAASKGTKELAEQMEKSAARWKALGSAAEKMATAASVLALISDGLSLIDAISKGDWDAALSATADIGTDVAPLVFGADVAAPLAGAVIVIKADLEAFHLAAEFIRYCKDEEAREAASNFVKALSDHVYPWAQRLTADVEVMLDSTVAAQVQQAAQSQVSSEAKNTWDAVKWTVANYLEPLQEQGAALYRSLGSDAIGALDDLTMPAETKDGVIELAVVDKVAKIFHGANLMCEFVHETYTN